MQVGQRNHVVVDNSQRSNARRCQILQQRGAKASSSDDEHARGFEFLLAGAPNAPQDDVTGVALDFFRGK